MRRFALLDGSTVANVILADSWDGGDDVTDVVPPPAPGWTKVGPGMYEPPEAQASAPEIRHITILAFDDRFTDDELATIGLASIDEAWEDDGVTPIPKTDPRRIMAAKLRARMKKSEKATYIDLDRIDTRNGVMQFEAFGLIAPGRALEILDAPIQPHEEYHA